MSDDILINVEICVNTSLVYLCRQNIHTLRWTVKSTTMELRWIFTRYLQSYATHDKAIYISTFNEITFINIILVFRVKRRKGFVSTEEISAWVICAFCRNVNTA